MLDAHYKVEWIPAGEQSFTALEQHKSLEEKTVLELRDMDPWDFEASGYRCTVTISRVNNRQPWWFSSCTKCHRASTPSGTQYKCSGGCPCTTAEPKYRLSLVGTDGTVTAEFTLFGRVARQVVGKPVVSLIRSVSKNQHGSSTAEFEHMLPELAALVSQKFTISVSISQKNLTQRNVSFQINDIVTFFGKQSHIPKINDASIDHSTGSSALVLASAFNCEADGTSNAPKRPRLDRRTIPCRKTLFLEDGCDEKKHENILDKPADSKIMAPEGKNTDGVGNSGEHSESTTSDDYEPIGAHDSVNGKGGAPPPSTSKQRSGGGRTRKTT